MTDFLALWALDTHASRYGDMPMPRRGTYQLSPGDAEDTVHAAVEWVDAQGKRQATAFDMVLDGEPRALPDGGSLVCRMEGASMVSEVVHEGIVVHRAVRTLRPGGDVMEVAQTLLTPDGERSFEAIYQRVIEDVKQVILFRKDLQMRKGKIAAQVAHASLAALLNQGTRTWDQLTIPLDRAAASWVNHRFAKIVLSVPGEAELLKAYEEARARGLPAALITDAGRTEFHGVPTKTTLAIGPASAADIDVITGKDGLIPTKLA